MTPIESHHAALPLIAPVEPSADWSRPTGRAFGFLPIPLTLFLLATVAVSTVDAPVARARLHARLPGGAVAFFDRVETFGHGVGIALVLTAVFLLDPARRRFFPRLLACAVAGGMAANVVKMLVARRRPWAWLDQSGGSLPSQLVEWFPLGMNTGAEQSFPSAHSAAAFGLALGLAAAYPRGRAFFLTIAACVGMQRAVFCAHYVSDVLAGAGAAWVVVLGLFQIRRIDRFFLRFERKRPPPLDVATEISQAA